MKKNLIETIYNGKVHSVRKYGDRFFAVYREEELIAVTVYKKGAFNVLVEIAG
jgi:hypothetical protein